MSADGHLSTQTRLDIAPVGGRNAPPNQCNTMLVK